MLQILIDFKLSLTENIQSYHFLLVPNLYSLKDTPQFLCNLDDLFSFSFYFDHTIQLFHSRKYAVKYLKYQNFYLW